MNDPRTDLEALTLGLYLAITAPTTELHAKCFALLPGLSARLSADEVARAQESAQARVEHEARG
jgi:hypothetical protein